MFQQQQKREDTLKRQIVLFNDAMTGLGCEKYRSWWQDPISRGKRLRCQTYRHDLNILQKLEWEYNTVCYNCPLDKCEKKITKLEARYASWLDSLDDSHAVYKARFISEKE